MGGTEFVDVFSAHLFFSRKLEVAANSIPDFTSFGRAVKEVRRGERRGSKIGSFMDGRRWKGGRG